MDYKNFWARADIQGDDDCWNWLEYKNNDGYGNYHIGKKIINAHRMAYTIIYGDIPNGQLVCHKCDNPSCINPKHLFLGTRKDNMQDASKKGRIVSNRLNQEQIVRIKTSKEKVKKLSQEFGVSGAAIRYHR